MKTNVMRRCEARPLVHDAGRFSVMALPDLLVLRWQPRVVIDRTLVSQACAAVAAASGSAHLPLLVEVSTLREVTWEAREAILACGRTARTAILGADAVDLVLTAFTVRSTTETRYFTDRSEAVSWLLQG